MVAPLAPRKRADLRRSDRNCQLANQALVNLLVMGFSDNYCRIGVSKTQRSCRSAVSQTPHDDDNDSPRSSDLGLCLFRAVQVLEEVARE